MKKSCSLAVGREGILRWSIDWNAACLATCSLLCRSDVELELFSIFSSVDDMEPARLGFVVM